MKLKYSFMLLALAGVMSANAGEPKTGVSRENLDESVSPCTDFINMHVADGKIESAEA